MSDGLNKFIVKAIDQSGADIKVFIESPNKESARQNAKNQGLYPYQVKEHVSSTKNRINMLPIFIAFGITLFVILVFIQGGHKSIKQAEVSKNYQSSNPDLFYDPSRDKPYKINEINFYYTRNEALKGLSRQFDRSQQWIENHMGSTNSVSSIHHNLNRSLLLPYYVADSTIHSQDIENRLSIAEELVRESQRKNGMRRKPWEKGYSLHIRKKAALKLLIQKGYSNKVAKEIVEDLVTYDLLPDPALIN